MNDKQKVFLKDVIIKDLFAKGILTRNYSNPGTFNIDGDKVEIHISTVQQIMDKETIVIKKATKVKCDTSEWIEEWRDLFPSGSNKNTGIPFKGDKHQCLKKMIEFRKDNDYTKDEIFEVTKKAIEKARDEDYLYFPAAHYFIHKTETGSKLGMLCELNRDGGEERERGWRTSI